MAEHCGHAVPMDFNDDANMESSDVQGGSGQ